MTPGAGQILTQGTLFGQSWYNATYQISKPMGLLFVRRFLKFPFPLSWQPEFCLEFNSLGNFNEELSDNASYQIYWLWCLWFGTRFLKFLLYISY